jgi:hypothetical protein
MDDKYGGLYYAAVLITSKETGSSMHSNFITTTGCKDTHTHTDLQFNAKNVWKFIPYSYILT